MSLPRKPHHKRLERRTELKAKSALNRTGQLAPTSAKRRKTNRARWELAADHVGAACRIQGPVCTGKAEHFHELVGRAQGGSLTDPRNLVPACDADNSWIEDNPAVSYAEGWKVRQADAIEGDRGLVPAAPSPLAIGFDRGDAA